jgi:hypothetical protein
LGTRDKAKTPEENLAGAPGSREIQGQTKNKNQWGLILSRTANQPANHRTQIWRTQEREKYKQHKHDAKIVFSWKFK